LKKQCQKDVAKYPKDVLKRLFVVLIVNWGGVEINRQCGVGAALPVLLTLALIF
jgi:hypothetical protein